MKNEYKIEKIGKEIYSEWLLKKHYAKRLCSVSFAYGLYIDGILNGVITFGMPPSSTLSSSICGEEFKSHVLELNRLVINEGLHRNALSYFVSKSINLLPGYKIIVSFADMNMHHHGYIYQATNFLYTGTSSNTSMLIDESGNEFHFRNIGHYQKNNKLNAKLVKRRINEHLIDRLLIAKYLRDNRGDYKLKELDNIFGYKNTASHWFRMDSGFSFPSVDDWIKLKDILKFDNTYDDVMCKFELVPCPQDIISKLNLKKVEILPKHRYVFFKGSKKFKSKCKKNLKLNITEYPKGENLRYLSDVNLITQKRIF